jgi:transposase
VYISMRDELGVLFNDADFAELFPRRGQPAFAPWRLALITVMQFLENLSDRLAAEAVRSRIDWKYAFGLELTDSVSIIPSSAVFENGSPMAGNKLCCSTGCLSYCAIRNC